MKILIGVLKGFAYVWLTLSCFLIGLCTIRIWMTEGYSAVAALHSPYNIANWLVTMITLAPGVGALLWAKKLRGKMKTGEAST